MAKVFTITEGLENLGAVKTGGQGSVYKARRRDGTITAVKLLPTPILAESAEDKHFRDFRNEVDKLRKVNEVPNPHVVSILGSGLTESGNFPFIEMEFIEGPDLEELLQPPRPPVFSIAEVYKFTTQLSNALAHCHRLGIRHGDIKSNNVKFNKNTGNYVLLDFGLAVMSDEQRRTSLRQAGAIEFMAPEQSEGKSLFQSDVYSFGVIMFELLTGQVPFPLTDRTETARNAVMLAHLDASPPDILELRSAHLPADWPESRRLMEAHVPGWMLQVVARCLEKDPAHRFRDGQELESAILQKRSLVVAPEDMPQHLREMEARRLREENEALRRRLARQETEPRPVLAAAETPGPRRRGLPVAAVIVLLALVGAAAFAAYALLRDPGTDNSLARSMPVRYEDTATVSLDKQGDNTAFEPESEEVVSDTVAATIIPEAPADTAVQEAPPQQQPEENTLVEEQAEEAQAEEADSETADPPARDTAAATEAKPERTSSIQEPRARDEDLGSYLVTAKRAYFHNRPEAESRRNAYIVHWNKAVVKPLDEENGFVYVIFTNHMGQTSRGWLRKADLTEVDE